MAIQRLFVPSWFCVYSASRSATRTSTARLQARHVCTPKCTVQERIVGEALLNKRPHPRLTPWLPPNPTLMQGIFLYQKTHMEELQLEKTKNAIRQVFIDTGNTPFEVGRWKGYCRQRFTNHRRSSPSSTANQVLSNVLKLQDKKSISVYVYSLGLDDQDPAQWGDAELSHLVVPEAD